MEEEGERRQGAGGRGGGWRGGRAGAAVVEVVVRETSPMPGLHPRCHRRIGVPARCSHELRGPVTQGQKEVM